MPDASILMLCIPTQERGNERASKTLRSLQFKVLDRQLLAVSSR